MNKIQLSGTILSSPTEDCSPSGLVHHYFWLNHKSIVSEYGFKRKAYCTMRVVTTDPIFLSCSKLIKGLNVIIDGFITYQKRKKKSGMYVVHAESIIKI